MHSDSTMSATMFAQAKGAGAAYPQEGQPQSTFGGGGVSMNYQNEQFD